MDINILAQVTRHQHVSTSKTKFIRFCLCLLAVLIWIDTSYAQTITNAPTTPTWNAAASDPLMKPGISVATLGMVAPTSPFIPTPPYLGALEGDQVMKMYDTQSIGYPTPPATGRTTVTPDEHHHHNWDLGSMGNVYGIAVDNNRNTYVTASTNYGAGYFTGAGIVGFGGIGDGQTADTAALDNNTQVLNSTVAAGAIYKIDAITGNVSLLASIPQLASAFTHENCENLAETQARNTGPALGNVEYDPVHDQLFVSNFEDGKIYRLSMAGAVLSTFDPFLPDNGVAGLPPDPSPYGLTLSADGSTLYFGTLDFANPLDPGLYAVNLTAAGEFTGSEIDQDANLTSDLNYAQAVGGGFTFNPWTSYSDLKFSPRGELMIGVRTGCGATAPNLATSHNHGGTFYKLIQDGSGLFNTGAPGTVGPDGNFPIHYIGDLLGPDDGYGGIGIYDKGDGTYDYMVTSADIGIEEGPHGFLVFPHNYDVGDNVSTYFIAQGSAIPGLVSTNPPNPNSDYKGVFGDIEVLGAFLDWGDAPDSYNTDFIPPDPTDLTDLAGPAHIITGENITIGTVVDFEKSGIPGMAADGDDSSGVTPNDEDGITGTPSFVAGTALEFNIPVNNPAGNPAVTLYAWLDIDMDGTFGGAGEFVRSAAIPAGTSPTVNLNFGVAPNVDATTYLRLRITSDTLTATGFEGYASNGEVEDHTVAFQSLVSIGNLVWMDNGAGAGGVSNDGIKQSGEIGVPGVVVQLFAQGQATNTTPVQSSATLGDGSYIFNDVPSGSYFVHIPAGEFGVGEPLEDKVSTTGQAAADNEIDDNVSEDGDDNEADGVSSPIYDLSGDNEPTSEAGFTGLSVSTQDDNNTNNTVDFGFYQPVSIGNLVWMDNGAGSGVSNDGIRNGTEPGVPGVVVQLFAQGQATNTTPVDSTTTAADGSYILTAPPGQYFVHIPASEFAVTEPLEDKVSTTGQGSADNTDDDNVGEDGDDNEADGVSSLIYDLFPNLEPASEAGFVGTTGSPSDDNNTNSTADFGFYQPVSIGNLVWMDNGAGGGVSNDGIRNGTELGVPGVVVQLFAQGQATNTTPVDSTTTAADGSYILTASPGAYFVHIPASEFAATEPLEDKISTTGQGAADNADDDNVGEDGDDNEADGVSSGIYDLQPNLEPGSEAGFVGTTGSPSDDNNTNSTADFGFYQLVSIGNLVWMDNGAGGGTSDDGIRNGTEPGVPGVVVQLFAQGQATNTTPVASTMTAADGSYILTAPPGAYFVHIPASEFAATEPLEHKVSTTGQGSADNTDDDNVGEDGDDNEADGVSSGIYNLFPNLEPSSEAGFVGITGSPSDDNNTNSTADFGFYEPVSIGNLVWMDNGVGGGTSDDGIRNGTELGVPGVVVQLFAQGQATNTTPVDSTTTAADGSYILTGPPGAYFVHIPVSEFAVTEPLEDKVSTTGQGAADNTDDDNVGEDGDDNEADGVSSGVYDLQPGIEPSGEAGFVGTTVSPSEDNSTNSTADFGFYQLVSIGNLVWMDNGAGGGTSNDGIRNGTELGVPGVVVQLFAQGQATNTTSVDSTTTAADGSYVLTAAPGEYFVHIPASEFAATEPLEDKVSTTGQGSADNTDDDNVGEDGDDNEADGVSSLVYNLQPNLEPGSEAGFVGTTGSPSDDNNTNSTADFGFYQPVSIGNLVWMDNGAGGGTSNDGIRNGTELGVPDVIVQLFAQGQATNTTPVDSTTTAADGSYILTASPGAYFVHIPASEFAATEPLEDKVSTTGQGAADNADDDNVGEDGDDNEADGVSSGIYDLQPNLEPGSEAGFVGSTGSPSDDNNTNSTADFGFYQPVSIGNLVWMDNGTGGGVANDGILNGGELGVPGVVVQLFAQGQATNTTPVDSTTTAADGSYILTASPGEYFVHIPASEFAATEPLQDKISTTGQGTADNSDDDNVGEDGDDNEADGVSSGVYDLQPNLEPGSEAGFVGTTGSPSDDNNTNSTADFGFYQLVSIGNLVWMDNGAGGGTSNDGIVNGTEPGVPGVVVQLFAEGQATNTTPVASTSTQADGSYIINNIVPGSYFVHIPAGEFAATEPLEDKVSTTGQGAADNAEDDNVNEDGDDTETDGISSGVYILLGDSEPTAEAGFTGTATSTADDNNTNSTVDFGFYQPVSIGNLVWMDNGAGGGTSNDGILNGTEAGVPGVIVQLFAQGQATNTTPVDSTMTAADGSYILTGPPGEHFVHIPASEFAATEPLEDKVSTTGQGTADNSDDDNVGEDGDDNEADGVSSGIYDLQPNLEPGSEAGFVGTTGSPSDDNNTNSTADFGFYQPVSIGNLVWMDNGAGSGVSNDGIVNGTELGVPGVVVQLFAEGQATNTTPVDTTTTAADGSYILTASPGTYFVHIPVSEFAATEPLEDKISTTGQGTADNADDDNVGEDGDDNEADGVSSGIYDLQPNLEPGGEAGFIGTTGSPSDDNNTNSTADFGFYQQVSIGNLVWMDNGAGGGTSNDGILNGTEQGVPSVVVQLFAQGQATNTTPVDSTTTAADGSYILTAPPGAYFVHIPASEFAATEPLEDKVSTTGQGAADNADDDNVGEDGDDNEADGVSSDVYDLQPNIEPSGEAGFIGTTGSPSDDNNTNSTADFGFYQPVSIGNLVWMDNGAGGGVSNDGILNGTELGVPGVVVQLFQQGQATNTTPVDSTTTAADGSYILTGPPGEHFVHIPASEFAATEPLENKVSTTGQGSADNTDDDNVGEDGDDNEADGVSSLVYDLQPNLEPGSEAGFVGTTGSPSDDNNTNSTADFGFYQPVSIGNLVWMDNGIGGGVANDGIINGTEAGVENVVVQLFAQGQATNTTPVDSTATAADGSYILTGPPGEYFVHIPASEFAISEPLAEKVSTTGQGTADNTNDDNVGEDGDDNEADGVSSLVYDLQPNLEPGSEAGFVGTTVSPSDDNNTNSTADFGFYAPVSLGNLVWMDNGAGGGTSNDGIVNGTEPGVPDVVVQLFAEGQATNTTPVATTTTQADGSYIINNIVPGSYFVHVPASEFAATEPLEDKVSSTGQGAADNSDDDNVSEDGDDVETDGVSSAVYVLLGDTEPSSEAGFTGTATSTSDDNNTNSTADFGFYQPVSIGNLVWMDNGAGGGVSNDGILNGTEVGVSGVVVQLFQQGQATNTTPVDSTTTAADGSYILTGPPGQHFVHIPASEFAATEPLEDKVSTTGQGTADNSNDDDAGEDGDDNEADGVSSGIYDLQPNLEPSSETGFVGTTVSPSDDNNTNSTADFGFYQPVSIGNLMWMDNGAGGGVSDDGIINGGEVGVPGVVVQLFAQGQATNTTPVDTTTTAADGSYILTASPGTYFVHIPASEFAATEPLEDKVSTTGQGTADNTDDDNIGEDGDDNEADGVSSGVYDLQPNLEPGSEAGFVGTTISPSDDNNTNSTADFGFYQQVSIGNLVWMDDGTGGGMPNDGIVNGGEVGVANVVVQLFAQGQATNTTPVDSTATAADGSYVLTAPPGQYFVHIPDSEFAVGEPLEDKVSSNGQGTADNTDDDNVAEDGDDNEADGVSSGVYDLQPNIEPTLESGFVGTTVSPSDDNSTNSTADFGFLVPASIGSFVWNDLNGDGIQSADEPPVTVAEVELLLSSGAVATDLSGANVTAANTVSDGLYVFSNLPPASYKLQIKAPPSLFATSVQTAVNDDDTENDSNVAAMVAAGVFESGVFTLVAGAEPQESNSFRGDDQDSTLAGSPADLSGNMTIDFGFVDGAAIGNYVWLDFDMDGVQDANEDGIANVTVNLFEDTDGNGVIDGTELTTAVETAVTGPNGEYLFQNLMPGKVYITQVDDSTLPSGFIQTFDEGSAPSTSGVLDHTSDPITLVPKEEHLTADFGYVPPLGSIGDTIWVDANDNGIQDPGEPGLPGVEVTLTPPPSVDPDGPTGPLNPGDPVIVLTDENGKYLFTSLPLGNAYVVAVTANVPPQYSQSPSGLGDPDVRDGNSDPSEADESTIVVLLSSQPINLDADFGYLPASTVNNSIGDTIWKDLDEDGNGPAGAGDGSDANEPPIAGVTVTLINSTGDPIATIITDADGKYLFTGLPDGDYTVLVTDANNVLGSLVQTVDSDDPANPGGFIAVTPNESAVLGLAGGAANLDQDFGYVDPSNTGTTGAIGDVIFFDEDSSGTADPGEGLEGVTVQLFDPGPDGDITTTGDNILIGSTVTDENGGYLFTGISIADTGVNPGTDYQVVVVENTLPNGGAGWVNDIDPDATTSPGDSASVVTLSAAIPVDLDQDFGYVSEANNQISGTVWSDSDGDGMQAEAGRFEGVTIELLDSNGNLIQTVETDANGDYQFTNLPDGMYTVVVTDDNNVLAGYEHTDSPNGTSDTGDETSKDDTGYTVDLDSTGISPTPVMDVTGDFGYEPTVTNPISLGSFLASSAEDGVVQISWATQTEVSNIGFNLYALIDDDWLQLNISVILSLGDSVAVQAYTESYNTDARVFALGDIDLTGKETLHGPFQLGQPHGVIGERKKIDWQAEKEQSEAKKTERELLRLEQQRFRNEQRKSRMLKNPQSMLNSRPIGEHKEVHLIKRWFDTALISALGLLVPSAQAEDLNAEDIVNLKTTEVGIHQLRHEELLAYGIDLSGEPISRIALINRGNATQIKVTGSTNDYELFGQGAHIQFIAQKLDTLYSETNVYTLRLDQDMASRMPVDSRPVPAGGAASAYLSKATFAPQKRYSFASPDKNDPWYASRLVAVNNEVSQDIPITLDDFAAGGNSGSTKARLSVSVWGATDLPGNNDHHVRLSFNGVPVAESHFDGLVEKHLSSQLDNVDSINQVTVSLPMDTGYAFDAVNLNKIEVDYPRKFRAINNRLDFVSTFSKFRVPGFSTSALQNGVSDLIVIRDDAQGQTFMTGADVACNTRTCRVQLGGTGALGHYYLSTTNAVHSPLLAALPVEQDISGEQAVYLIISHPDFIGPGADNLLETLATELASELGSAQVVDVDSVYAQYGNHLFDPRAIQAFIKESVEQRGTRYVLLVGGDVYDYRRFTGGESKSFIPSIYASTGNHINFAPVDAKYVDLDDDNVPDLPIGRLPVRTVAQLQSLMSKRTSYLNRNYAGRALLVADEIDAVQEYDFSNDANQIQSQYLSQFSISKAYVDELGVSQARAKVIQKINQGQTLTSFFGHSSTNQWAFNGLFTGPDAANLTNVGKPTVVTQWGCWNTYYVSPNEDSMGHRFMMEGNQGAVSVMGASTLTNANSERKLAALVFARIANGERLGDAITGAKQEYAQQFPNDVDVLLGWTLLGLPDLKVN